MLINKGTISVFLIKHTDSDLIQLQKWVALSLCLMRTADQGQISRRWLRNITTDSVFVEFWGLINLKILENRTLLGLFLDCIRPETKKNPTVKCGHSFLILFRPRPTYKRVYFWWQRNQRKSDYIYLLYASQIMLYRYCQLNINQIVFSLLFACF